jgi:4-diphosphocytidyl-2-C-methyl-D-erythritol kinase
MNLFLHILGKRVDGYHELQSLVGFADIGDQLTVAPAQELSLQVTGTFSNQLSEDNLVLQAAKVLQEKYTIKEGAAISLDKQLPIAAGLGGGSSDAATTITLLCQLWGINAEQEELYAIARSLGADVSACLYGKTCFMEGIGEKIAPVSAENTSAITLPILLLNTHHLLSTKDVYSHVKSVNNVNGIYININDFYSMDSGQKMMWLAAQRNEMETAAAQLYPEIDTILSTIAHQQGCVFSRMAGSGATCFGVFEDVTACMRAKEQLQITYPDAWICTTKVSI